MPSGRDPDGAFWTVRRVWWPFATWLAQATENELVFTLALIATAPMVLIWPFWLLTRFAGRPWTLVVRRMGEEMNREQVEGWSASRDRMAAILRHVTMS